jgi:hypothetical protein
MFLRASLPATSANRDARTMLSVPGANVAPGGKQNMNRERMDEIESALRLAHENGQIAGYSRRERESLKRGHRYEIHFTSGETWIATTTEAVAFARGIFMGSRFPRFGERRVEDRRVVNSGD